MDQSLPPPTYSEATTSALITDGFAVSPLTEPSTPVNRRLSVSPLRTPIHPPPSETWTFHSSSISKPPQAPSDTRNIDDESLPEAVVPDNMEVARVEHTVANLPQATPSDVAERVNRSEYASGLEVMAVPQTVHTVTPLHLLGDQPDSIDCPFCLRRTETRVKKKPSNVTHLQAVALLMTTVCGAAAPYLAKWSFDVEQFCTRCNNRVTYKSQGKELHICKAPESWKQPSKYSDPDAASQ
ncbi:hypothetical protein ACJ41O_015272 [Fusarium nematophilum]